MPERRDRFMPKARFAARNPELQMHGSGLRLLARQGLEDLERGRCAPTTALRGPENEPSDRMGGTDVPNFSRLLRCEVRILLEELFRVGERRIDGACVLCRTVHSCPLLIRARRSRDSSAL